MPAEVRLGAMPERIAIVALDGIDKVVGEFFAGDVDAFEFRFLLADSIVDGLQ